MKKTTLFLTMLITLGLVGFVYAEGSPTTAPVKKLLAKKEVSLLRGDVVSIDADANTITVTDKSGKSERLNVGAKVKILKELTLSEVSAGDKVTISYKTKAGQKTVTAIKVKAKKVEATE
jgi:Cu/Ag efflux protein CusF